MTDPATPGTLTAAAERAENVFSLGMEKWLPVPGYENFYEVSDIGTVRSLDRELRNRCGPYTRLGRRLKMPIDRSRGLYRYVGLTRNGSGRTRRVHQLVCVAFHGEPEPGQEVRHQDGDSLNNCAENLCWGTRVENSLDMIRHGTHQNSRKTHCKYGHEFTEANTRMRPTGGRSCRSCDRDRDAGRRQR